MAEKELQLTEINPYTECTVKQQRYIEARMQGLTITAAGKASGVLDPKSMERSPKVRKAMKYLVLESTKSVDDLTKSDVMSGMMDAVHAASTATELIQAWRELGKLIGAYEPERRILEVHDYSKEELRTLSDEELLKLSGGKYADAIDADFKELDNGRRVDTESQADLDEG